MLLNRLLTRNVLQAKPWRRHVKHLRVSAHSLKRNTVNADKDAAFGDLFQRSKFATMLDPIGQRVEGEVVAVVKQKIYVDFGFKFHAVVSLPREGSAGYRKGTRVVVRLLNLEITNHFIGDHRDISLLEAEAELVDRLES